MRTIVAAALIVVAGPVLAEPIPKSDVLGACKEFSIRNPGADAFEVAFDKCVAREQKSYDRIKQDWDKISEKDQLECIEKGPQIGKQFFYASIVGCVIPRVAERERLDEERRLRGQLMPKKEFRY